MNTSIIGVPMDLGANRRGVDMGPSAIRYAGLSRKLQQLNYNVIEKGDISVPLPEIDCMEDEDIKYPKQIETVTNSLAQQVSQEAGAGNIPVILGGDHSIAIGSIAGMKQAVGELGVIWFDAHADLNTFETSPSGNIHGMPLAFSLGYGESSLVDCLEKGPKIKPENIVLIGARDLDSPEKELINEKGITVFTMHDLDKMGMNHVMKEAISILSSNTDGVHISLDMDVLDPVEAPGVGTPVRGGINYREVHLALELLSEVNCANSIEVVEVNPILDEVNRTGDLAVELIASALGKRIL